jgi:hypothetical protein
MAGLPRLATFGERRRNHDLVQLDELPAGLPIRVQQEISLGEPEAEADLPARCCGVLEVSPEPRGAAVSSVIRSERSRRLPP